MSDLVPEKHKLGKPEKPEKPDKPEKPEKPDEELYNVKLKKAEKEYSEVKAKFVSYHLYPLSRTLLAVTFNDRSNPKS